MSVCLYFGYESFDFGAETNEPIEMLFVLWTCVGPGNHAVDGGPEPPMGRANFRWGHDRICHDLLHLICKGAATSIWLWQLHNVKVSLKLFLQCLQCFDAVGWVAGRAPGL